MGVIRQTKSVKSIIKKFQEANNSALSVVDLVKHFKGEMNKTTVYRILERLEEEGKLHSFTGKDGRKWFAQGLINEEGHANTNHAHFQCQECGKSKCLTGNIAVPSIPNHKVELASLILIGQCEDCIS